MTAELGVFALILALFFAFFLVIVPSLGLYYKNTTWQDSITTYALGQLLCVLGAYTCLTLCFLMNDFTVSYVLLNSSLSLPWFYKLCAVWGGHEGSMLLWVLVLSVWMVAVVLYSKGLALELRVRIMVILGGLSVGFILFLLTTSNPFSRQFSVLDSVGRDLNPLLQDIGFLFHPPMLYMGYVGFSVAFAFALAALWLGKMDAAWAMWTRPWTVAAWSCLTLGITLGSWWAYRELGWGGWWFWDPVENASFMPWLLGTALLHSLMINQTRGLLNAWTALLAIGTFSLSLVGTFLVRSGVLISVHAFAVDPARGQFILLFLLAVIGGSLLLFALRANQLNNPVRLKALSREGALLLNNVFLAVMMLTVLLGTAYPLLIDGLGLGKLSVGAPYFNAIFTPLALPFLFLMGIGIHTHWQRDKLARLLRHLVSVFGLSVLLPAVVLIGLGAFKLTVYLGCVCAVWLLGSNLQALWERVRTQGQLSGGFMGMLLAHTGIAMTVLGIVISSGFGLQRDVKLAPSEHLTLGGVDVTFVSESSLSGPNYHGFKTCFKLRVHDHEHLIFPEKRVYDVSHIAMTDAAIDATWFRDVYVALGEPLGEGAWSVRLYYKPMVRWIWAGGVMMMLGGVVALTDRRYRRVV
jgi:cytochrome c-type biogenesis protein CcmF